MQVSPPRWPKPPQFVVLPPPLHSLSVLHRPPSPVRSHTPAEHDPYAQSLELMQGCPPATRQTLFLQTIQPGHVGRAPHLHWLVTGSQSVALAKHTKFVQLREPLLLHWSNS
jgi:hypothetical protein